MIGERAQAVPSHASARAPAFPVISTPTADPTAMQSLGDIQETALRLPIPLGGVGDGTSDHELPSHDSASVGPPTVSSVPEDPTALQKLVDVQEMPLREFSARDEFAVDSIVHLVPFHFSARVLYPVDFE